MTTANELLHQAVENDNTNQLKAAVMSGADVSYPDENNITPLMKAVQKNNLEMVRLLLSEGADVNAVSDGGKTAFSMAIANHNTNIALRLMTNGALLNDRRNFFKSTPLIEAVRHRNIEVLKLLLFRKVDVNLPDRYGNTALSEALYNGFDAAVPLLIKAGADVNAADKEGTTPLMIAATNKSPFFLVLANHEANIFARDLSGETVLMKAVLAENKPAIRYLCDHGVDLEAKDLNGNTALILAAEQGVDVMPLLQSGADVNAVNNQNETALMKAVRQKNGEDTVIQLCLYGAELFSQDKSGRTVYHYISTKRMKKQLKDISFYIDTIKQLYYYANPKLVQKILRADAGNREKSFRSSYSFQKTRE